MAGRIDLDCGIALARIVEWLDGELALSCEDGSWIFESDDGTCQVSLAELEERALGPVKLKRTRLVAEGDADTLDAFNKLFTLRFISAGG